MASTGKPRSSDLAAHVAAALKGRVAPGARLALALSGGVDSVVLLDILARVAPELGAALSCVHVNHAISPNAPSWAAFCAGLGRRYGLPVEIVTVDIAPHRHLGLEGAARHARYAALGAVDADAVVLGHHRDDQAETVLLQLLRGAGVAGLAGMPVERTAGGVRLLRPMLGESRDAIAAYAKARELEWIEDESNVDIALARNFIRHRVMPVLAELNPSASASLALGAAHLAEAGSLLGELAAIDAEGAVRGGRLSIAALQTLTAPRARNLLRWFLAEAGLPVPARKALDEMLAQLTGARRDGAVRLAAGDRVLRRFAGEVWIVAHRLPVRSDFSARWHGEADWAIDELGGVMRFERVSGNGILADALRPGAVSIRVRRGGERFRPDGQRPSRTLKNLLQEHRAPPWQRERLPLVYAGDRLAFVPGLGMDAALAAPRGASGWRLTWHPTT